MVCGKPAGTNWKYLLRDRTRAISQGHEVSSHGEQVVSFESQKGNLWTRWWVRLIEMLSISTQSRLLVADGSSLGPGSTSGSTLAQSG
jgi:hypothetical protein